MSKENITDPGLSQLHELTKNVMIPLLIRAFQLRSEAVQLQEPPSRLYALQNNRSLSEIISQLSSLEKDLKLQQVWIESSRAQVAKILLEIEAGKNSSSLGQIKISPATHPAIQKSFQNVFSSLCSSPKDRPFSWRTLWKKIFGIS
jgi:hypothetical protein